MNAQVQLLSSPENTLSVNTTAAGYEQTSLPVKAVNSLDALMSAVSNLDLMANPRALKKKHEEDEAAADYTLLTLPDDDELSVAILPDSYLPVAAEIFNYLDKLKQASDALELQIDGDQNTDNVDRQLLAARTTARSVSAEAVKLGVTKQDYVGTKLEVSEDLADPDDPFSGGDSASLPRALGSVASSEHAFAQDGGGKGSLAESEIKDLVQASCEDKNSGSEDDAGVREPAVITQDPALSAKEKLLSSPDLKIQNDTGLQADGVAIAPQFVEGLQDGESYEQMLLRVQQAALAQLQAEDAVDAKPVEEDLVLPETPQEQEPDGPNTSEDQVLTDAEVANQEKQQAGAGEAEPLTGNNEVQNTPTVADFEKTEDQVAKEGETTAKQLSLQPDDELQKASNDDLNDALNAPPDHQNTAEPAQILLKEIEDPFADETEVKDIKVSLGISLEKGQSLLLSQHDESSNDPAESSQKPQKDVVGELLRSQIFGKGNSVAAAVSSLLAVKEQTEDSSSSYIAQVQDEIPPADDDSFYESDPALADAEDFDPDDEDELPPVRGVLSEEELIPEEVSNNTKEGISVLPDGRADDVPVAQQLERERIEQADKDGSGRVLGPDDFMEEASRSDDWARDFIAAGYSEGALYSALCASVRREDPAVADRWIVVMSDNFKLFAMDPNFTKGMIERFSAQKGRHIEISLQTVHGIPKGSVKELASELYLKACDDARAELERMPFVMRIAKLAGSDLRHCPLRLLDLKKEKKENGA